MLCMHSWGSLGLKRMATFAFQVLCFKKMLVSSLVLEKDP